MRRKTLFNLVLIFTIYFAILWGSYTNRLMAADDFRFYLAIGTLACGIVWWVLGRGPVLHKQNNG